MARVELDEWLEDILDRTGRPQADLYPASYCSPTYWEWEGQVARPILESLGYTDIYFADGERDSFGPLSRAVMMTDPSGQKVMTYYG